MYTLTTIYTDTQVKQMWN